MSRIVQKYGGSSVADAESILRVARRITRYAQAGHEVVVVVSAMGDTTDDLLDLAARVTDKPPARELDMLLTAGERISMAVLSMALNGLGVKARSFTGSQAGVITDGIHGKAHILDMTPGRVLEALDAGDVAIVAGFQGVSRLTKDITTLGRGGSDTTAVALAAALDADVCEIYSDVDGVFTADPRIVPRARRIPVISPEEMLEMAASGSKILMMRCVEYARRYGVTLHVRSSFSGRVGTIVAPENKRDVLLDPDDPPARVLDAPAARAQQVPPDIQQDAADIQQPAPPANQAALPASQAAPQTSLSNPPIASKEEATMEQPIISGVAHDLSEGKITVVEVPDQPGKAAAIFEVVAQTGANIDMIVQNVSTTDNTTAISFTLPESDAPAAISALEQAQERIGFQEVRYIDQIGKVSLVGAGMKSSPGVSATLFHALAGAGINIDMISTSEIRISVVTEASRVQDAVCAIHTAFGLDSDDGEAVVYGGTGR
ncbi:aspartate kinase [Devriesea agamarum]|uniref:aspartate kinase n=1 Tax=Devriesea agamarum TaxID=472569 RepID=UPI00071D6E78|nr:aspartate kinase [Devriesea agamarum]